MTMAPPARDQDARRRERRRKRLMSNLSGAVALVAATAVVTWLLSHGTTRNVTTTVTSPSRVVVTIGPVATTPRALGAFAKVLHQPVYWAGPEKGFKYELTENSKGEVYVRYLPHGVKVGDPRASFLVVATYPFSDPVSALKAISKGKGVTLPNGTFVLQDATDPRSVHLAFPGVPYEIEVYDPVAKTARTIAMSGRIKPAG